MANTIPTVHSLLASETQPCQRSQSASQRAMALRTWQTAYTRLFLPKRTQKIVF